VQGPFPVGNSSAQPDQRFAFPVPADGSRDQTFRLMVRPDVWGRQARLRFTNALGTKPLALDGVYAGTAARAARRWSRDSQPARSRLAASLTITIGPGAVGVERRRSILAVRARPAMRPRSPIAGSRSAST
jgi:hypothetical protein